MNNNKFFNNIFFIFVLILLGIGSRLIPHPPNLTAIGAVGLFLGAYSRKKNMLFIVPLITMFISDLCLFYLQGKAFPGAIIYLCLLAYIPIGSTIIKKIQIKSVIIGSLFGATFFYIVSNFSVWVSSGGIHPYTYNIVGLINCYTAAIPFYMNSIVGNFLWCSILFGAYELCNYSVRTFLIKKEEV